MKFPNDHKIDQDLFNLIKQKLDSGDEIPLRVQSNSMAPIYWAGDQIFIKKLPAYLKKYDIVVFWTGDVLISHYFKHENYITNPYGEKTIVTCGMNTSEDFPIPYSKVVGIVISHKLSFLQKLKREFRRFLIFKEPTSAR